MILTSTTGDYRPERHCDVDSERFLMILRSCLCAKAIPVGLRSSVAVLSISVLLLVLAGCSDSSDGAEGHSENGMRSFDSAAIQTFRQEKNDVFRQDEASPIPDDRRDEFPGLRYFEPDPDFAVNAKYTRLPRLEEITMMTTSGESRRMLRSGLLQFSIGDMTEQLTAYKSGEGERRLFIPFRDATNGVTTYPAGRYLEVEEPEGEMALIDFNYAYNPFCAYNESYSCPVVPLENVLVVGIEAGERMFRETHD